MPKTLPSMPTGTVPKSNGKAAKPPAVAAKPQMPAAAKPPAAAPKPAQVAQKVSIPEAAPQAQRIKYPHLECRIYARGGDRPPVDLELAKALLGWEDEAKFAARIGAAMTEAQRTTNPPGYADAYDFRDITGAKIKCWNNSGNRELVRDHALELAQDVLTRNWADSRNGGLTTFVYGAADGKPPLPDLSVVEGVTLSNGDVIELPEITINGETIIITRTGKTNSGQHRLIGYVFACQLWAAAPEKYPLWKEMPTLEAPIFFGVSDSPKVTMTLDNVMPRSEADTIYTTMFADKTPMERKELSRMLALATDLVWKRTGAGNGIYQTHSESKAFRERHPGLEKCVLHVFQENRERPISKLKLSAGTCAGLMYLFAASQTQEDKYHGFDPRERSEAAIDMAKSITVGGKKVKCWDAAHVFLTLLASSGKTQGGDQTLAAIGEELVRITTESGKKPSLAQQTGILCIAWNVWSSGDRVNVEDLRLTYDKREDGTEYINEHPEVGGIDLGVQVKAADDGEEPTEAELKEAAKQKKKDVGKKNAEAVRKSALEDAAKKRAGLPQQYAALQEQHPGKVLLLRSASGSYCAYGATADRLVLVLGLPEPVKSPDGITRVFFPPTDLDRHLGKLREAGVEVVHAADQKGRVTACDAPKVGK